MKQKMKQLIAIVVILMLAVLSLSAFIVLYHEEEEEDLKEIEEEFVLDDKVSPYTNQGLIVEMLRVRNRDLLNRMMSFGTSWKEFPQFYYTIQVDDVLGNSKGHLGENEVYIMWDTFGKESSMDFEVEEEQKKSDVTITIIELEEKGLFGRRTSEVEKEKIQLTYDFRTGRWSGDDSFNDKDGFGYYLGEDYEVWFNIYQSDYDHDAIPYWTEVNILGTDPTVDDRELDPDNDGIPTDWEWRYGYDPFAYNDHKNLDPDVDGIENLEEYQVRKWFSNPFQPDIYIETDGMNKKGPFDLKHEYYKEAQQMVIERFAQHGIKVFIDDGWDDGPVNGGGEMFPYQKNFDDVEGKQLLQFYNRNFADERKGIFRYALAGTIAGFTTPVRYNYFDTMEIGNSWNDAITARLAFTPRTIRLTFAAVAMHELGHSLGLVPIIFPGNDIMPRYIGDRYPSMSDEDYDGYVNEYYSIMNYKYIYDKKLFDYSDGSNHEKYDMDDWASIYLPSFQLDQVMYEEPSDETFEDFEIVRDYPGVIVEGWELDENLTEQYAKEFEDLALLKNTNNVDIQVFVKENAEDEKYNIRVYAKPNVEPVYSIYSLVEEGNLDSENNIEFYSQQDIVKSVKLLI
jgi:hypothetical protein